MAHLAIRSRELFLVAILYGDEETHDTGLFSSILALLAFSRVNVVIVLHETGIADLNGYATQIVFHTRKKTGRLAAPKVSVITMERQAAFACGMAGLFVWLDILAD